MKNLSLFNKIMFVCNIVLAVCTFIAYILPFLAPKLFPFLSVFTLGLPMMLILNLIFFGYWAIQFKRQILLSGIVLLIGITFINKFYKFAAPDYVKEDNDFAVMSYNVRLFNKFGWSDKQTVPIEISDFVNEKEPSILCIQEFSNAADFNDSAYKYHYIFSKGNKIKSGQAIFSKFRIVNSGNIVFPNSSNNTIFADIIRGKDTIRVYSMHLQSIKISPDVHDISEDINEIDQKKSEMMFKRIGTAFRKQQQQAEIIMKHKQDCKFPIIICGDMNNSAFSYVYRNIKGDLNDCFVEAGKGFGKTYDFNYYPARIDYIFADNKFDTKFFCSYPETVDSDHFPIMAVLSDRKK
ncbi:MAG: endonuclease [Flavobacterium sp. BFFFF1]|uniref:endonuclease/exonuclease/phosphatase family protein n=1 Tax=Flavobacterium sp. BFFFF1 TaxID=2015557 RepID=UPI000BD10050|nr:endonuclease/exonuclease/phosphatase family protein [Flavobacterium sp. BFFFF1]OYU80534.1 MAG: endonuclease [Flavobacterium sp. BFFFF1]